MKTVGKLRIRRHSSTGPKVIVLHGGPGAIGSAEELARGLSDTFSAIEPWQRGSGGDEPLTVARHVEDLHDVVQSVRTSQPPALVGESWGAMLALAYAAEHPSSAGPIVLVGCGTFDRKSRALGAKIREERIGEYIAKHPQHTADLDLRLNDRIMKWHEMTDSFDPMPSASPTRSEPVDMKAHTETWEDLVRCQEIGLYPKAFSAINSPVIMLHGSYDPHPGKMIRDSLKSYLPQLEYREFEKCGHNPAIEKFARDTYFVAIREWLAYNMSLSAK
ncbi:MAG: alpha/beta hydrolase [Deltaproteobacteria bacterium]|nr:alpha/beta hydrolase [Deltaproteobacteria bacterium]